VVFSAGGDAVVNPHEPGVIADWSLLASCEQQPTREAAMAAFAKSWRRE
jgi:hypothetical protein